MCIFVEQKQEGRYQWPATVPTASKQFVLLGFIVAN
jgi:hypothetical protein